jgi:hypothetical protein
MNIINKHPVDNLGYNFIDKRYIPEGQDEYYLRYLQQPAAANYRKLNAAEIEVLVRNNNTSDNWNHILVSNAFSPDRVKNCQFHGLVRIGNLEPLYLEFHNLRMQVGLYNSTIISCDIGNNVCINNVNYLSHYIIDDEVMIANVNELSVTGKSKFGNGILFEGEEEKSRVWMELCNENGGRRVLPFSGMLPGDAWLWSKHIADTAFTGKLKQFTEEKFDRRRGRYGKIGKRTVIKNCKIIKDVLIGTDAYLKGANKLKNLTIKSDEKRTSQIGEGCELVNGIVGYGCRIFYGVKAVRFVMASHSQLKYGARLINSYLGNNSTISCCEVLNSLIFPAHEQHHNNSFLCAAVVMGQSNIAAGATIGSNHNSRSADGEIVAGRGFWPGLCVSLKHNSLFASYTLLAKGDYPAELNIPIPFSLVSNDVSADRLVIMPGYWFLYNMYALERNARKSLERDRRTSKIQRIEYDYLAPDTVNELLTALALLKKLQPDAGDSAEIPGMENSRRKTVILKVSKAIALFTELIEFYVTRSLINHIQSKGINSFRTLCNALPRKKSLGKWVNVGGQLMREQDKLKLIEDVKKGRIASWDDMHDRYRMLGEQFESDRLNHAFSCLLEIRKIQPSGFTSTLFKELILKSIATREWMVEGIYSSRERDYTNPFRTMVYDSRQEMDQVIGRFEDNPFILQQQTELEAYKKEARSIIRKMQLK